MSNNRSRKACIVTFSDTANFGSILQCVATNKICEQKNYEPVFVTFKSPNKIIRVFEKTIDYLLVIINSLLSSEYRQFRTSIRQNNKNDPINDKNTVYDSICVSNESYKKVRMSFLSRKKYYYDCYICGSDQIWSPTILPFKKYYYLNFADKNKKMAYAPSFGVNKLPSFFTKKCSKYIKRFKYLSVREYSSVELIKALTGNTPIDVLDPTLVLDYHFWDEYIMSKKHFLRNKIPTNYCFCYFLNKPNDYVIEFIRKQNANTRIIIAPFDYEIDGTIFVKTNPVDFLNLLRNAKKIYTDSFHGVCFSINYNKQFVVFEREHNNRIKQTSRIDSILTKTNLMNQKYNADNQTESIIDYKEANNALNIMRNKSKSFIDSFFRDLNN